MQADPQIVFDGVEPSEAVRARIEKEVKKLEQFFGRIIACRTVVKRPQRRHQHGDLYSVAVHLSLPDGRDIHTGRNPSQDHAHEDVYVAIRDAFKAARRNLQEETRKMRGDIKHHEAPPTGTVRTLVAEQDHGFIEADDGREIYFHRNSVANDGFADLRAGSRVSFSETRGDKGPQATIVRPL